MKELTINQEKAIELLLTGKSQRETADIVGVTARTMTKWVRKPLFSEALETARDEQRQAWRAKRRQLLEKNFTLLDKALGTIDIATQEHDLIKLTNAVAKMSDQIRAEYGDMPTSKHSIEGGTGKLPLIEIDGELWSEI